MSLSTCCSRFAPTVTPSPPTWPCKYGAFGGGTTPCHTLDNQWMEQRHVAKAKVIQTVSKYLTKSMVVIEIIPKKNWIDWRGPSDSRLQIPIAGSTGTSACTYIPFSSEVPVPVKVLVLVPDNEVPDAPAGCSVPSTIPGTYRTGISCRAPGCNSCIR